MRDIEVIDDPAVAAAALDPVRARLLAELAVPGSAATLGSRLGLTRQKVNYHLRALEDHGLIEIAQTRQWGGLTERLLVASAAAYVVSPAALGQAGDIKRIDRRSPSHLIALAARMLREVWGLMRRAEAAGKPMTTLAIDAEVRFASPADRAAFAHDLTEAVGSLIAHYNAAAAPDGKLHRVVVVAHQAPSQS